MRLISLLFILFLLTISSCTDDTKEIQRLAQDPSAKRGRTIYLLNCITCHNRNPSRAGSQGPAIKGSSRILLEAKILHGSYPQGYVPKRTSRSMRKYPRLKNDIIHLGKYLQ